MNEFGIVENVKIGYECLFHVVCGLSPQANYTDQATAACRRS
jgi:hypothetical protein